MKSERGEWTFSLPPKATEKLRASRKLVNLFTHPKGQSIGQVLTGEDIPIDIPIFIQVYHILDAIKDFPPDQLTSADTEFFMSLRDSLFGWFFDRRWTVQPPVEAAEGMTPVAASDNRHHRLLLPAKMINTLTKLVLNKCMEDVPRDELIRLSDQVYAHAADFVTPDYLSKVAGETDLLKHRLPPQGDIGYGFDLRVWMSAEKDFGALSEKAAGILRDSYKNTRNYFLSQNTAAGLYFIKSVVIGKMQEWHQQRLGITTMVPPIAWQQSESGHSLYDFRSNTNAILGDMHTNNKRFPFEKCVAYDMQVHVPGA